MINIVGRRRRETASHRDFLRSLSTEKGGKRRTAVTGEKAEAKEEASVAEIPNIKCRKCGFEGPATAEYFMADKSRKYGVQRLCRECSREKGRRWRSANPEKAREIDRRWKAANPEKVREQNRRYRAENSEKRREYQLQWETQNREKVRESNRRWYAEHGEEVQESHRRYHAEHLEEDRERSRRWRVENSEKAREGLRRWKAENPEKIAAIRQRRKARKRGLPDTLTAEDWEAAITFFDGRCAYCGVEARLECDHYIPLMAENCPGTVRGNVLPACGVCNSSKRDKLPQAWLRERFGAELAEEILTRVEGWLFS
ncbi:MAG: hypothetical protein K8I30_19570 [Anaerolineae bacterium]|nr:hypothetical protein [Anaerolineae bacterium]